MRFLIDNNLSPLIATGLREAGYDAFHVREYMMRQAEDTTILERAAEENRVVISQDTDFGELLAASQRTSPSIVLIRWQLLISAEKQLAVLLERLPVLATELETGSFVVIEPSGNRVKPLPLMRKENDG